MTKEEYEWVKQQLLEYIRENNFENADTFRFATKGNEEEERKYNLYKSRGCCGFFDTEVFNRTTRKWYMIGCNYGH